MIVGGVDIFGVGGIVDVDGCGALVAVVGVLTGEGVGGIAGSAHIEL